MITKKDINNIKNKIENEINSKKDLILQLQGYINGLTKGLAEIDALIDLVDKTKKTNE